MRRAASSASFVSDLRLRLCRFPAYPDSDPNDSFAMSSYGSRVAVGYNTGADEVDAVYQVWEIEAAGL